MKTIYLDMEKIKEVDMEKFYEDYYDEDKKMMKNGTPLVIHLDSHYVFLLDVPSFAFNKHDAETLEEWVYSLKKRDPIKNAPIVRWRRK